MTGKSKEVSIKTLLLLCQLLLLALCACSSERSHRGPDDRQLASRFPVPAVEYAPRHLVCYRTDAPIDIDGRMDEPAWQAAAWTEPFVDIEGDAKPAPRFETRAKMLWDSDYFYIAALLEEPDLWGTLTERDAVVYHDNDFEVFIDPDGDSHEYYELEINALGTEWDLLLVRPYRDGAPAVNAWDIQGLKTGISVSGTLNDPGDRDSSWSVEIAIPWKVLAECAHRPSPPHDGDTWWVNFSRVQWHLDTVDGGYVKRMDSSGEKSLPENNWVWSPQGLIAMHYPEMWGLVQFSTSKIGTIERSFEPPTDLSARWALRQVYYAEREFEAQNGRFTDSKEELALSVQPPEGYSWPPRLNATDRTFTATITSTDNSRLLSIGTDGRLTSVEHKTEEN